MRISLKPITILMADDNAEDRQLTKEAFEENCLKNDLRFVENGEEQRAELCKTNPRSRHCQKPVDQATSIFPPEHSHHPTIEQTLR